MFPKGGDKVMKETVPDKVAQQTNTTMSLFKAHESFSAVSKGSKVWLGEGLGSIPKQVHDRMIR